MMGDKAAAIFAVSSLFMPVISRTRKTSRLVMHDKLLPEVENSMRQFSDFANQFWTSFSGSI
jgi:hypothetical protein